jgi:hypothetical protein
MEPTFEVLFVIDRTGKLELVLTDTTNAPDTYGHFKIRYPDGVVIENDQDFEFPQIEKRYDLRVRNKNIINGEYEITQYLEDGSDVFTANKVFTLNFNDPALAMRDNSNLVVPNVSFLDITKYPITGYNESITRSISCDFPETTNIEDTITTPAIEIFMEKDGNYYEGEFHPELSVNILYTGSQHEVRFINKKSFIFKVKGFIPISEIVSLIDKVKSRLDKGDGNKRDLMDDYFMVTSLYTQLVANWGNGIESKATITLNNIINDFRTEIQEYIQEVNEIAFLEPESDDEVFDL